MKYHIELQRWRELTFRPKEAVAQRPGWYIQAETGQVIGQGFPTKGHAELFLAQKQGLIDLAVG